MPLDWLGTGTLKGVKAAAPGSVPASYVAENAAHNLRM